MAEVLDYAAENDGPRRPGAGYYLIVAINGAGLIAQCFLLIAELDTDPWTPLISWVAGGALLLSQLTLGAIPAIVYAIRQRRAVNPRPLRFLLVFAWAVALLIGLGIALGITLPRSMRVHW